jgi:integrase
MILELPSGMIGVRDRALLLIGFCGAFRRSELVSLDHSDVQVTRDGLVITLRRSKTDQTGEGRKIGVPFGSHPESCPVRAFQDWLDASAIISGPLFRPITRHGRLGPDRLTPKAVAGIVKRSAKRIGLDVATVAGHSLRSGLCTSAADAGASERSIMNQSGHRSLMTVRRYIKDGSLFKKNAAAVLGL